ncbi:hypothetical protein F2P45_03640 [Massilia sp. CCM 8733]|uniref:HEAT repeat domain-containing protein n=1 Tax=Massilia mucilaginosa TaxID=2609282 RepID=A0ABX0NMU1_9BURK|nr:HEAT repeat domain-containing protein [Massilia mucilaginosa]NHZ88120.1 hypothetical protein [Massilia mucilaginosa]
MTQELFPGKTMCGAVAILCLACPPAPACSVAYEVRVDQIKPQDGFVTRALAPRAPVHLPANAAGVVYQSTSALDASAFTIDEEGGQAGLALRVRPLAAPGRLRMLAAMREVNQRKATLFRVEPRAGFEPGKTYAIRRGAQVVRVHIDPAVVEMRSAAVDLVPLPGAHLETVIHADPCYPSASRPARQELRYALPAQAQPYRHLMLSLLLRTDTQPGPMPGSPDPVDFPLLTDASFFGLGDQVRTIALDAGVPLTIDSGAVVAFLEVDDGWHRSVSHRITLDPATLPVYDSLDYLRAAIGGGDSAAIRAQLALTPVRESDYAVDQPDDAESALRARAEIILQRWRVARRHAALERSLNRLGRHRDPAVRGEALRALARAQTIRPRDPEVTRKAVVRLVRSLRDPELAVRRSAVLALLDVGEHLNDGWILRTDAWQNVNPYCAQPDSGICRLFEAFRPARSSFAAFAAHPDARVRRRAAALAHALGPR